MLRGPVVDQAALHGLLASPARPRPAARLPSAPTPGRPTPRPTKRSNLHDHHGPSRAGPPDRVLHRTTVLRPATVDDTDATWTFPALDEVNDWLGPVPWGPAGYCDLFAEPDRLATTVVIELGHGSDRTVIGDPMLRREDAWAQLDVADAGAGRRPSSAVLDPAHSGHATPPRRSVSSSATASRTSAYDGGRELLLENDASWRVDGARRYAPRVLHAVRDSSAPASGLVARHRRVRAAADEWEFPVTDLPC